MKLSIPKVPLVGPFVRQKGGIIFRIINVENEALNLAGEDIFWIEGKVFQPFKIVFVSRKKRRTLVTRKKGVSFFSPFQNLLSGKGYFLLILSPCRNRNSLGQREKPNHQ
jgi:hypothetical protein